MKTKDRAAAWLDDSRRTKRRSGYIAHRQNEWAGASTAKMCEVRAWRKEGITGFKHPVPLLLGSSLDWRESSVLVVLASPRRK